MDRIFNRFGARIAGVVLTAMFMALPARAADGLALGEPRYVVLEPVVVSIMRDARVRGLLSVDVGLEVRDADTREDIEKALPRLRDRYIQALTYLASNRIDVTRPVDVGALGDMLQSVTDSVLGASAARVLVSGATVRRL